MRLTDQREEGERDLIRAFDQLDRDEQRALLRYAETLLSMRPRREEPQLSVPLVRTH